MANPRDALITGIGLVSCLGEGVDAHWAALNRQGGFQPSARPSGHHVGPLPVLVQLDRRTGPCLCGTHSTGRKTA